MSTNYKYLPKRPEKRDKESDIGIKEGILKI